jgi:hypothetical protein
MPIYEIMADNLRKIEETTFGAAGVRERDDLQRLLRSHIDVISPGDPLLVIAEEFGEWEDSRRRIDLLAVDKAANLVVIELKRTEDGGHMELQALRYAAMVSTMTFENAVEVYAAFLAKLNRDEDARQSLLDFLDWDEPDEEHFAQDVRLILVSAEFSKEVTTTVLWLNDRDLDIRCVRLKPYSDKGRTLLDVQQVIPLPEAAEYQVQVGVKSRQERIARESSKDFTKYDVTLYDVTATRLAKRNAIFAIVKRLCDHGVTPEAIVDVIPWRKQRLFRVAVGQLEPEEFTAAVQTEREAEGQPFRPKRWFCAEDQLIYSVGKTYAFSNQWGVRWHEAMTNLINAFPEAKISYRPSQAESD